MSVVDEVELARACIGHIRRAYPTSPVLVFLDTQDRALHERWAAVAKVSGDVRVIPIEPPLYGVEHGGRVVRTLIERFLSTDSHWWLKIDPDTYVRRSFDRLPEERCFFGTLQGGNPMPSLQGGCIGGVREAAAALYESGVLHSPELVDYESSWAKDNPILLHRARERGLVSFDFVHAWACKRVGIPLVDHPEIRSHWLSPPGNGAKYAVTHPHKDLANGDPDTHDNPSSLAERVRGVLANVVPAGAVVAVVSHGDDELVDLNGREAWHFPRQPDGYYAGAHPADSGNAIAHLESLRARGATYLVVPEPSFWWLDHYLGFRHHLERYYEQVTGQPGTCIVYDLHGETPTNLNTQEYWNSIYREECEHGEADEPDYKRDYGPLHEAIVQLVPGEGRVLDVACGVGLLCRKLKARCPGVSVVGVDFSDYVIERNRECDRNLGIDYRCLDIRTELPTLEPAYNVVTFCEILEHLDEPERVVAEAVALLRPGGRFVLTCPHDDEVPHPEHVRRWGHDEVFHLLARHGDTVTFHHFGATGSRRLLAYVETPRGKPSSTTSRPLPPAVARPNEQTLTFLRRTNCHTIAEIGVHRGDTSEGLAHFLGGEGELHLFDFEDVVADTAARLRAAGHANVVVHANSRKRLDSYNWSLMRLLQRHAEPVFDYVYLDGAHIWTFDALAFLLIDRLLKVGGYVDFDDYHWSYVSSPTVNPTAFPVILGLLTDEQIETPQVALVVDLLVRRDPRYEEVVPNKIFRKTRP